MRPFRDASKVTCALTNCVLVATLLVLTLAIGSCDFSEHLNLYEVTGTVFNVNYTAGNPAFVSIFLPYAKSEHAGVFCGFENPNGVFVDTGERDTIYAGSNEDFNVGGQNGYYLLVYDIDKEHVTRNYMVKYLSY